jgi:hypothetical protein
MAYENTFASLNGLFKEVWSEELVDAVPDHVKFLKMVHFLKKDGGSVGRKYHQGISLGLEHGCTLAPSGDDLFDLEQPINSTVKDAEILGSQIVLRAAIGVATASRAVESKAAYKSATKFIVGNMLRSITKKLEIEMFYGQMGYAIVDSVSGAGPYVLTIEQQEWAPAIWAGAEKMNLEIVRAGSIVATATVTKVSFENKTVTVTATAAPLAADVLFMKSANAGASEFMGIHKIITTAGSLFGINNNDFSLWKGNEYDASNTELSLFKIEQAIARAVEKGLDEDVVCFVNPKIWAGLLSDQAALRKYDQSYKSEKLENGSRSIMFYGQNGGIEIVPSTYIKEGYAYVLCVDEMIRVGSTDVTFKRPGMGGEQFFRELESKNGYEMRAYADFALFVNAPGKQTLIKNIAAPTE